MTTSEPRLAVVICTYNRSHSLIQTLASLYADGYAGPAPIDILVIANNCNDDTLTRLAEFRANHPQQLLRLAWREEPKPGKSYALNTAIAKTDHDVLCFIDDDQTVEPGFLASLSAGIAQYPDDDIFCGRLWPAWDGSEPSWVHAKPPYAIPIRPFPEFDRGIESVQVKPSDQFPGGGNINVRRRVFERIGGFSTELGPTGHNLVGGEDHDFLHRAVEAGHRIRFLPSMRQLHAIDAERMSTSYTLRKSFLRSRASFLVRPQRSGPRLYMLRKVLGHFGNALFSFNEHRRFFYLVRLAASTGELAGAIEVVRSHLAPSPALPPDRLERTATLIAGATAVCGATAWLSSTAIGTHISLPTITVAAVGALMLLGKSIVDFSQTGPLIRDEMLTLYRGYVAMALARLTFWAFVVMTLAGGIGTLAYRAATFAGGWAWSSRWAALAAALGIGGAVGLQFLRTLRYNPGLLIASMHYRASRLYRLWSWVTPRRLSQLQWGLAATAGVLLATASWKLVAQHQFLELLALWSTALFYLGLGAWAMWLPEVAPLPRTAPLKQGARPNILLIGSDTLRADRLSALGYRRALTPNLDTLAKRGTLFANCYVPCARTAPSLISLLTGTWPHTHGVRDNFVADDQAQLGMPALPQLLKPLGYRSAAISDWCGADMSKFSFGFDHTDLPEDQWNLKYLIRQGPKDLRLFLSLFTHNRFGRTLLPEIYYLGGVPMTDEIGPRARALVSRLAQGNEPFFLNVFYSTTHPPFASEWPWYTRFSDPAYRGESKFAMARLTDPFDIIRRQGAPQEEFDLDHILDLYDGCVAQFDHEVGRMLGHLQTCGLADNTIVVVYSDHGMEFFEHETWGQGNSAVGEASPRIPLVVHDPRTPGRGMVRCIVRSVDIAPTLLQLAGATLPATMDGVSLGAFLTGEQDCPKLDAFNETGIWIADVPGLPDTHLRYPNLLELLEVPDLESGTLTIKPQYQEITLKAKDRMIRRDRWKLVYQPLREGYVLRLYDVVSDPDCVHDLAATQPEITAPLWAALQGWMAGTAHSAELHPPHRTDTTGSAAGSSPLA